MSEEDLHEYESIEPFSPEEADIIIAASGDVEPPSMQSAEAMLAANAPRHFYWPNVQREIESNLGSRLTRTQEGHLYDIYEQLRASSRNQEHSSEWARRVIHAANLTISPQGRGWL